MSEENQIVIYQADDGEMKIDVQLQEETIWLTQAQMAELFEKGRTTITEHIRNIFKEGELEEELVCRDFRHTTEHGAIKGKTQAKNVKYYNLDVIISVGYRVKSQRGTQFRIWANKVLKEYLLQGYALNEKKLQASQEQLRSLQEGIKLLENVIDQQQLTSDEAVGLLKVVSEYSHALELLDQYDHQKLVIPKVEGEQKINQLVYDQALDQIKRWRDQQGAGELFGNEKDQSFRSSLETIYQTFGGEDLYPSVEEKAANLLYFVVKNHSFTDGNKRIAAGLFAYFLDLNSKLYKEDGRKIIADNALVAITIMIAESKTEEKDMMIKLIVNLMLNN
jgi:prophage maintenance system killer protein